MSKEVGVDINDVGLIDHVSRERGWEIVKDNGKLTSREQSQQYPIPEDIMSTLEKHIGDAQAKVTVGCELKHSKEYGNKAGSFVSVTVTCNNDETDIEAVHSIVHPLARKLANEDLEKMKEDRDAHLGITTDPVPGKAANPPRASVKPPAVKPGAQRPSFRR